MFRSLPSSIRRGLPLVITPGTPRTEKRVGERPAPFIQALRRSHDSLRALAEPLTDGQLEQRSYCTDWSIAQVSLASGIAG